MDKLVKYQLSDSFEDNDIAVELFVWTDPNGPSYARTTLSGPSRSSFMVFFTQKEPNNDWEDDITTSTVILDWYVNDADYPASGYVVNPTDGTGGEIFLNRQPTQPKQYASNYSKLYTQNSNITDFSIDDDTASMTFERAPVTTDAEDWAFDFAELLNEFYICYIRSSQLDGVPDELPASGSSPWDCKLINSERVAVPSEYVQGNCYVHCAH